MESPLRRESHPWKLVADGCAAIRPSPVRSRQGDRTGRSPLRVDSPRLGLFAFHRAPVAVIPINKRCDVLRGTGRDGAGRDGTRRGTPAVRAVLERRRRRSIPQGWPVDRLRRGSSVLSLEASALRVCLTAL